MTDIEMLEREIQCVQRKAKTNCTNCGSCDLLMDNKRILAAYTNAIAALRVQKQREQLWHDVETDLPPQPGLYYGAKDDTNAMWLVQYRDGAWTLDSYPDHPMNIVRWAFYDAFTSSDDEDAKKNKPLTLEELREMDGQPVWVEFMDGRREWGLICIEEFGNMVFVRLQYDVFLAFNCGIPNKLFWSNIYRHPPEDETP